MDVTVYTTPTCMYCHQLKNFLQEKGVDYTEVDVSQDQEAARRIVQETGQMGVPVTKIDDRYILGFARDTISEILDV